MGTVFGRWLRASLVGSIVLASLATLTASSLSAAPSVEIAPTITPGTFDFLARGFEMKEEVSTWVTGPRLQVQASGIFTADSRGDVGFTMRLPRHFEPGRWAITVHGLTSDREAIGFFWLPELGPNVPLVAVPEQGPRGTTFVFRGSGFDAGEPVNYWPTGPTDTAYEGGQLAAASDGSVEIPFFFGLETQPGQWAMSAYGMKSGRLGVAHFTLT